MSSLPLIVKYLITVFIGMIPIVELRGAIPFGIFGLGLEFNQAFICAFIGNIIPVYFIVKYIRPLFNFFGRWKPFKKVIDWATEKATKKIEESTRLQNFVSLGLFLFVAIPLPGTGAWIGSLIANFLDVPPKKAVPVIIFGVAVAGVIMSVFSGGVKFAIS